MISTIKPLHYLNYPRPPLPIHDLHYPTTTSNTPECLADGLTQQFLSGYES